MLRQLASGCGLRFSDGTGVPGVVATPPKRAALTLRSCRPSPAVLDFTPPLFKRRPAVHVSQQKETARTRIPRTLIRFSRDPGEIRKHVPSQKSGR